MDDLTPLQPDGVGGGGVSRGQGEQRIYVTFQLFCCLFYHLV